MFKSAIIGAATALLVASPALACTDISSKTVKFTGCVDDEWVASEGQGAQEFVYLTANQDFGLQIVTENAVVPAQAFHDAILKNAAAGSNSKPDDVKVISERVENIDGKPFNVLEYTVPISGNPLLFQNFYYSQPGFGSIQILGFSLETDGNAAAYKTGVFASTVKIGE